MPLTTLNPILILKKDNKIIVVHDWPYSLAPTTYYHHIDLLKIEMYEYDYCSKCGKYAFYKFFA